jgi:hypothetical protein
MPCPAPKIQKTSLADMKLRDRFLKNGFAVIPGVLDQPTLSGLRSYSSECLARQEQEHFDQFRFHGSMLALDLLGEPLTQSLVANENLLTNLARLGFEDPRWLSGYLISKPPQSPSLWWHQDWWAWDEPESFFDDAPQLFVMFYLRDVTEHNGALRVIPGSHRNQHPLHSELPEAHGVDINATDEYGIAHRRQPDEITVNARAGDAVVGDVRLLHATHSNASDARRTCITLWYLPKFESLSGQLKSYVMNHPSVPDLDTEASSISKLPPEVRTLIPRYSGDAAPANYNRVPPPIWEQAESSFRGNQSKVSHFA